MSRSPILDLVDFVDEIVSGGPKARPHMMVVCTYFSMVCGLFVLWDQCSDKDFSFVLTAAAVFQALGFFLLLHKVRMQKSVAGISSKTLQVYVLVFMFRLTSTMVKNGYLPVDATGDWVYQASDIASLLLVFQLLYFIHKRYKHTYQDTLDTMPIWNIAPVAFVLGFCFHGNLNHSLFFDKAWTIGMWLDTVAMLPQLWMLVAKGGEVEALTANFVALIFASKGLSFWFWFTGYPELAPADGGFNTVGFIIMAAHSLQLLFSADFMYHYFVWQASERCEGGCGARSKNMVLPMSGMMEI